MASTYERQQAALEKALLLIRLDPPAYVVPCWRRGKDKGPCTPHGFYDAVADEAGVRSIWATYPGTEVGVWPGPSQLLFEDIDTDDSKGVNGYRSLDQAEVSWESSIHYRTPSGGEHHVWHSFDAPVGPAAPITGFTGVDRRADDSLCLWYGSVPSQEQWTAMHTQTTPEWLAGPAQGRKRSSSTRTTRIVSVDNEDVHEWIDSLTEGDPVEKYALPVEHYGELVSAMTQFVEHTRTFPTWPGGRATFEFLANSYVDSPVSTTPEESRPGKVIGIVRWALGVTADVQDLTWAYERFGRGVPEAVPAVPATRGDSEIEYSSEVTKEAGTRSTAQDGAAR